ncbi:unnamed protein product [Penicillium salamii]|nr:unnamed protein product [Penicillium salamii]
MPKRMISDLKNTGATTANAGKIVQRGVQSEVKGTYSCNINLSCKVPIHLRAAISNTQDTSGMFLGIYKVWESHSSSLYLYDSDSGILISLNEETELRLFSQSLQILENTIFMAEENSVLSLSDVEWTSVLSRKNELLSAAIDMNREQHVLLDRRLALKRIARESEAHGIRTRYHRNVIDELLSEITRLPSGPPVYIEEEDQLPIDALNAMAVDHQCLQRDEAPHDGESHIFILWRT